MDTSSTRALDDTTSQYVTDSSLQDRQKRRAQQIGLRFMHLSSNWLTHTFVKHDHDVGRIDESGWPLTLQESADEHRLLMSILNEGNDTVAHAPRTHVDPSFRDPSLSVAIVSLCAYPSDHPLPRYATSNHKLYATRHGYSYFVSRERVDGGRPVAWGKIRLMQKYLEAGQHNWVMWFDCDTYFMNMSITIDSLLYRYGASRTYVGTGGQALVLDPDFHFLVTEDHAMLNTGVFMMRTSSWSVKLLQDVWGGLHEHSPSVWTHHPWWEQAAFSWVFWEGNAQKFAQHDIASWAGEDEMEGIYPDPVRVAPQGEFNSYHPITSRFLADTWAPGKFVIAFNGVLSSSSPTVVRYLYGHYYETACRINEVLRLCEKIDEVLPWLEERP